MYRLLLVDGHGRAASPQLGLRTLREVPGLDGVSVHFRPVRNDGLFESAKIGGELAYRILRGEGAVRGQLWVEYELAGEPMNVTGRSSDLLFALALIGSQWDPGRTDRPAVAATGVLDARGNILGVDRVLEKVAEGVRALAHEARAVLFYPAADEAAVLSWRSGRALPDALELVAAAHLDEALVRLGYVLERVYLRNPYRGLEHFDYEHRSIFFGRDAEIRDVINQLLRREAARMPGLLVEGPSGSGKSSFLRAGVLPTLVDPRHCFPEVQALVRARPVSPELRRAIWRPGLLPELADERTLARSVRDCWAALPEWRAGGAELEAATLMQLAQLRREHWPQELRFIWLIDQFEELLKLGLNEALLAAFGDFLGQLQRDGAWSLACIRADILPQLKQHEGLRRVFGSNEGQYYLAPMGQLALDDVIDRPARTADLHFGAGPDGRRVDQLLRETAYRERDILPLLQFTLNELYLRRGGNELTYASYQQLGGLAGSVAAAAAAILQTDTPQSQRAVRRLFRTLISVDQNGLAARRYAPAAEIAQDPEQQQLVTRLVQGRLCVTDRRGEQAVVAFAHDSLLCTLPALIEWLRQEQGLLQTRELAEREAQLWQRHGESNAWLAASEKVSSFSVLEQADIALPVAVQSFLDRSVRQVRRSVRLKQAVMVLIGLLAVAASIGAWIASRKQRQAEEQIAATAQANRRILTEAAAERLRDGDLALARGIILEVLQGESSTRLEPASVNVFQEIRAQDPALVILTGHDGSVRRASFSPDGTRIITSSGDHTARIWDARTGVALRVLTGANRGVRSAAWSPDGTRVVAAPVAGAARVWDAGTGIPLLTLRGGGEDVFCAAYSPDATRIATVSERQLRIWDARSGAALAAIESPGRLFWTPNSDYGYLGSIAFSPDGGRLVAAMDDRTARIWDLRTGKPLVVLSGHTGPVATVAWAPDGRRIVTSGDTTARIWDAATGRELLTLKGHVGLVWYAVFSPDGTRVATAGVDKTARIFDASSGASLRVLTGHVNVLSNAEFSPDGSKLVTAGLDGTARTWNLNADSAVAVLHGHTDQVARIAFSPDGTRIASVSMDRSVRIWDAQSHDLRMQLPDRGIYNSVVFSPDGARLLAAGDDGLRIWDAHSGAAIAVLSAPSPVYDATYSADGHRIVAGMMDGSIAVWDADTGRMEGSRSAHGDNVTSAVFSPDGSRILTASVDKTARVWDARSLNPIRVLSHRDFLNRARYSPDGRRIVSAVDDSTARIWDAASGDLIGTFPGHGAYIECAAFSPDGNRIVTGSGDTTLRIWDARSGLPVAVLRGHRSGVSDCAYAPDGSHIASASQDGTIRLWDARALADLPSQILWMRAAEADPISELQRSQLGLSPTNLLLAATTMSTPPPADTTQGTTAVGATLCDQQAGAWYDPGRHAPGLSMGEIEGGVAVSACEAALGAGHPPARALYQLGRARLASEDFAGARRELEAAVARGYAAARIDLGGLLTDPKAGLPDPQRALSLYEQAWRERIPYAGFALGQLYEQGVRAGTEDSKWLLPPDAERARRWYRDSAQHGQPDALARLAEHAERDAIAGAAAHADGLLLQAFRFYALAEQRARAEQWPLEASMRWRYRRSSLARVLAADGRMAAVAAEYQKVLGFGARGRRAPAVDVDAPALSSPSP